MWIAALAAISSGNFAMAAPTILDFEDITAPATITAQYAPRGAIFQEAYLGTDPNAHSGTRVLRTVDPSAEIFNPVPLVIKFTSPQARVKLFASNPVATANGTLTAFDTNGAVVATDGPTPVAHDVFTTVFEVKVPIPTIARVELQVQDSAHQAIDDLEFEGEPPSPVPTEPPVVQIISPANGADLDVDTIDINGTVTGEGLLSPVTSTFAYKQPPESTAPPLNLVFDLTGSGTTRQFQLPGGFSGVPMGPITITAKAQNTGNLTGTATSTFNNLPAAIRDRFNADGGAAAFGAFRFGLVRGACKIAVYEQGAISANGGATFVIRGQILIKWLSLKGPFNSETGYFGCPLGEERDTEVIGGARVQDFERGRIYGSLLGTAPPHTAYVPIVFVEALNKRGGELVNGLPRADPSDSVGPSQTWLFQRFFRPDRTDQLLSTLEIRGTPATLWMERQGGNWFLSALEPSDADKALNKTTATLWESFPCSGNLGPCTVEDEPPFPPENISNAGAIFCGGSTYWPGHPGGPPEWVAIQSFEGDWVATPVFGAVISNFMADIDNVFTHEHTFGGCPYCPDTIGGATTPIGGLCPTCPSDYEFKVRPIGPQPGSFPRPSLFGKENLDYIKIEHEEYYAAAAHNFLGAPRTGDLVHLTGRWIIDCGHSSYKSELHPIFSYATMKTVVSETNSFTGLEEDLFGGIPATRVAIWVNGWYPGGETNEIQFDAFPPPRPSPDAVLHVVKPVDSAAGGYRAAEDVTMQFSLEPVGAPNHVHLKFSSPRRQNTITDAGEMKFESGRQYWGKWYLYWGQ